MIQRPLYTGVKSYWKTKNSVKIAIVEHADYDVFEVIVFDLLGDFEAERVFVDALALRVIIGCTSSDGAPLVTPADFDNSVTAFICTHLFIKTYLPVSGILELVVRSCYSEISHHDLIILKPVGLRPSVSPFTGIGDANLFTWKRESDRNKWRQRLIFARLSNGLPLCDSDQQIWTQLMQDKTEAELTASMMEVLIDNVCEEKKVLSGAVRAILIPVQTPFPAPRFKAPSAVSFSLELPVAYRLQAICLPAPPEVVPAQQLTTPSILLSRVARILRHVFPGSASEEARVPTTESAPLLLPPVVVPLLCVPLSDPLPCEGAFSVAGKALAEAADRAPHRHAHVAGAEESLETTVKLLEPRSRDVGECALVPEAVRCKVVPVLCAQSATAPGAQGCHTYDTANDDEELVAYEQPPWCTLAKPQPLHCMTAGLLAGITGPRKRVLPTAEAGDVVTSSRGLVVVVAAAVVVPVPVRGACAGVPRRVTGDGKGLAVRVGTAMSPRA